MSYAIGIGVLLESDAFKSIRILELDLAGKTGNFAGLGQPPHITVKRPFDVANLDDIKKCENIMHEIAGQIEAFDVSFDGVGNFGNSTLFLKVEPNRRLEALHERFLTKLSTIYPHWKGVFEGQQMIYHATLAMDLRADQFDIAKKHLSSYPPGALPRAAHVRSIGLFLGIDNNTHWAVITQRQLA